MKDSVEFCNITKYFPGVKALEDICFRVESGEVLAFMGENGAGKSTLLKILNGDYQATSGKYLINGEEKHFVQPSEAIEAGISVIYQERQILMDLSVAENIFLEGKKIVSHSPSDAMENGIVLVPEDRKTQGILANLGVGENITIGSLKHNASKLGILNRKKEQAMEKKGISDFKIKTPNAEKKIVELSGGNQQKAIVARWMATNPKVLILDEPTKGIDIGAKSEFYNMICQFAKEGLGVILISSELPEVMGLSDRIIVMKGRKIAGEIMRDQATEENLLSLAMIGGETDGKEE